MPLIKTDTQPATKPLEEKPSFPKDVHGNWAPPVTNRIQPKPWKPPAGLKIPTKNPMKRNVVLNTSMLPREGDDEAKKKRELVMQQQAEAKQPQQAKKPGRPPKKV